MHILRASFKDSQALIVIFMMTALVSLMATTAFAAAKDGTVSVANQNITAGAKINITGSWLYKPGYALAKGERPEDPATPENGFVTVPVPQMLSRVRWWLDDSAGFDAFETKRLAALGFDTDRAEDGWYRVWIDLPKDIGGKHVFVRFDGVAMKCRAYLNGKPLGEHVGMFSRFWYDLTLQAKPGRNLLAVYVSMEKLDPEIVPLGEVVSVNLTISKIKTLSKGMFGPLSPVNDNRAYDLHGIWQPVTLEIRENARIDDAWFIPGLDSAKLQVEASSFSGARKAFVKARWTDAVTGKLLHETKKTPVQLYNQKKTIALSATGLHPKLWSPEKPNIYKMVVTLVGENGQLFDVWQQNVGFRTFEIRGNHLYLNNKPYWLRGANQLPYGKNPWDTKLPYKLIRLTHDGNTVITRTHCTPWNDNWLNAADEIGLGISIEGIRPWGVMGTVPPPSRELIEHWKMENEDVIRRCRNHPSVLIWDIGNEMNLRDTENIDKWKILSELVSQTRSVDPTRPVICFSAYRREKKLYEEKLKPAGIDDGDMDALHSYRGWYAPSSFVQDCSWIKRTCEYAGTRTIIGQEMATGYPNLDNGIPTEKYIDILVPQAWVGVDGERDGDPAAFLEHHNIVTKRLAEQLRYQRGDLTSGFMLFSSECWFKNSYDSSRISPYPVYEGVKFAFAPVGLAIETSNRRFFAGETVNTAVFITNDDKDYAGPLAVNAEFITPDGKVMDGGGSAGLKGIKYYETARIPISIKAPSAMGRQKATLRLYLVKGQKEISRTEDSVEVFSQEWSEAPLKNLKPNSVIAIGAGANLTALLEKAPNDSINVSGSDADPTGYQVAFVNAAPNILEKQMPALKRFVEAGGTAILLGAGMQAQTLFPECIAKSREVEGEYVDIASTPADLRAGFNKFDFKWWGRGDGRAFVISATHNLVPGGLEKELMRHIVVHGYIKQEMKPDFITSPLVEIPSGKGRFILCEFTLEDSASWDPVARRFASQLLIWGESR